LVVKFSRKAYSVVSVLLLCEILAQFYFIAALAFPAWLADDNEKSVAAAVDGAGLFAGLHAINGMFVIPVTIIVLVGLSFASRYSWRTTGLTAVLLGLMVIQFSLALAGFAKLAFVAGFHAVNAVALVGYAAWTVRRNWAFGRNGLIRSARSAGRVRTGGLPA
jgi:hypothetical protein